MSVFQIQTHLMALSQKRAGCTGFGIWFIMECVL